MVPNMYLLTIVSSQEVSSSFSDPSKTWQAFPAVECNWLEARTYDTQTLCTQKIQSYGTVNF
jgi:hypothetical protein